MNNLSLNPQLSTFNRSTVWDGDWAILEEYDSSGALVQKYLEGYHGLVKTFVGTVIYYYQDELGSTSHISSASGALLESYRYNLYGAPTYWSASSPSSQLQASAYGVKDLFTGQRWIPELGLYDDRNRFMSPDLGRFLQPDPIGFKGDGSNLYRYCGNDWANRTDPMGLFGDPQADKANSQNNQQDQHMDCSQQIEAMELRNCAYAPTANQVERSGGNRQYAMSGGQTLTVHQVTVQRFVQAPTSGMIFQGDRHGETASPTDAYRTTSTLTVNEVTGGSAITGDTGKTQLTNGHTFPKGERHFDGAARKQWKKGSDLHI